MPGLPKDTADRQRKLDELVREVLARFIGRVPTPYLIAEAEGAMRDALDRAIVDGTYVLPDGLLLDCVTIGEDMRLKVYFGRLADRFTAVSEEIADMTDDPSS